MAGSGEFSKSMITDIPVDVTSKDFLAIKKTVQRFPDEAIYIYSFKENKMVYADGWEEVLGYKDSEVNMLLLVSITSPEYANFSNELNDKALKFILSEKENLEDYSFTIELKKIHKNGDYIPLIWKLAVHRSEAGTLTEIICRAQINKSIRFGKVMRYAFYGPKSGTFEVELNKGGMFQHFAISAKEKEALELVSKGYPFKEIAHHLGVSQSAIEKRVLPLYKRFNVKSLTHLITFAYENHILP